MLHTHSFIYHRRCKMFFSQHFSFHCQYHSTNAPYSFIHLPPTLYRVFLPALPFPLPVPFHQFSILIHSTTRDAIWCFSTSTLVSPVSIITPMLCTHSFTYHRRYMKFFSQNFSCPLSVSFRQCSIPIQSSTTDIVKCFTPSTSVFPCQYHSTNDTHSFSHLPPTLHDVFLLVLQFSPVSIIPPWLLTHSFIYHRRYMMFFSQYFSFHCQYHSTNAPYSFIHLQPTL